LDRDRHLCNGKICSVGQNEENGMGESGVRCGGYEMLGSICVLRFHSVVMGRVLMSVIAEG
jgi:hypothetical protein